MIKKYDEFLITEKYDEKENLVEYLVNKMNPKPANVVQDIKDIFLEYNDQGIDLEDIELCVMQSNNEPITVYYPLPTPSSRSGKVYHHPSYGNKEVDEKILKILSKSDKIYYSITFGMDTNRAKFIQNVEYSTKVDWGKEDVQFMFKLVHECADELYNRLNDMYKINKIQSSCYHPNYEFDTANSSNYNGWKNCDPIPDISLKAIKVSWILEISN